MSLDEDNVQISMATLNAWLAENGYLGERRMPDISYMEGQAGKVTQYLTLSATYTPSVAGAIISGLVGRLPLITLNSCSAHTGWTY